MMQNEIKVGSLFSGIGGIEIGFEKQGFKTEWFIEKEPYAQEILKKRFPNTKIYGDVTTIDFKAVPRIDILTGGFPCQDISGAGKMVGIEGSRSSLWKYYLEAIRILRPRFAFIENVSALTIRGLNVVLSDLAQIGYDAEWYNLSASSVGAFHKRERIFILAYPQHNGDREKECRESCKEGISQDKDWKKDNRSRESIRASSMDWERETTNSNNPHKISHSSSIRCNNGEHNPLGENEDGEDGLSLQDNKEWENRGGRTCPNDRGDGKISNSNQEGLQRGEKTRDIEESRTDREQQPSRQGWWSVEPELGRVAHGIPNRVDRIKCLGNAVVPQCAEVFAKAIMMELTTQNGEDKKL